MKTYDRSNSYVTIYLLRCLSNNKIYIGQTWLPLNLRMGKNGINYRNSVFLFSAIQKYGIDNFKYEILDTAQTQEEADEKEEKYIAQYNSRNSNIGYNLREGGWGGKHSEESKEKIRQAGLGRKMSEENIRRITGNTFAKGSVHTDEWKAANSEMMKKRHVEQGHPMQGKHHTDEAKAKIGAASAKRVKSPEEIEKIRLANTTKKEVELALIADYQAIDESTGQFLYTWDQLIKRNGSSKTTLSRILKRNGIPVRNNFTMWTGKTHSEETKEKMSQSAVERWSKE